MAKTFIFHGFPMVVLNLSGIGRFSSPRDQSIEKHKEWRRSVQIRHDKLETWASWWFQPIWKNISQIGPFPQVEVNIRNVWNHHPVGIFFWLVVSTGVCTLKTWSFNPKNLEFPPETSPREQQLYLYTCQSLGLPARFFPLVTRGWVLMVPPPPLSTWHISPRGDPCGAVLSTHSIHFPIGKACLPITIFQRLC